MDQSAHARPRQLNRLHMIFLAIVVGILSGVGAFIFRLLLNVITHFAFYAPDSDMLNNVMHYMPLLSHPIAIIFIPVLGACAVSFLVTHLSRESRGHGVPEVIYAVHYKKGIISPIVTFVKMLASSITIGTGGSAGREGPIIQIGAALGSTLGQIISMPPAQRIVLIAAGAGSGIAATFGAPITGLVFAIELMLITVNVANVVDIVIAIISACCVSYIFYGNSPEFLVASYHLNTNTLEYCMVILFLIPFSALVGMTSFAFVFLMSQCETLFEKYFKNRYLRHVTGMTLVGIILYLLAKYTGQYYVSGVGYATINDIFLFQLTDPRLLLLLCVCKIVATCLTLGSGGSGGLFSPALFIGATLGAAYAAIFNYFFPGHAYTLFFIIAGMAGMVSGATGLIVTSIVLAFEVTRDYSSIIPIMIVVALSAAMTAKLGAKNIYTMYSDRKGFVIPYGLRRE
jgi:CIC family chloride channel protein